MVILMAARASRLENQDAIDTAIVSMLADPKEVHLLSLKNNCSTNLKQNGKICIGLYKLRDFFSLYSVRNAAKL